MLARFSPPRLVLAGCLVVLIYAYPGHLEPEALLQLRLVRRGALSPDAPVFTLVWRVTSLVVAGPLGMLLLQLGMFAAGTYALLQRSLGDRAGVVTAALLVFPPILVGLSVVSPWTLAAALLLAAVAVHRPAVRLVLLGLGVAIVPSAWLAVIPVLVVRERKRVALLASAVLLVLAVALSLVSVDVARARFDLTGLGIAPSPAPIDRVETLAQRRALLAQRAERIENAPGAYAANRARAFASILGLVDRSEGQFVPGESPVADAPLSLRLGVPTGTSLLQRGLRNLATAVARFTPLFWPALYLVTAIAILFRARRDAELVALTASGIAFVLPLAVTASSTGAWQTLWLISAALVAAILHHHRRVAG